MTVPWFTEVRQLMRRNVSRLAWSVLCLSFALTASAFASSKEKVLHNFGDLPDGVAPYAGLIFDSAGNLYGTSQGGGGGQFQADAGTIFELRSGSNGKWTERVLYNFCARQGCADGGTPYASLTLDAVGNLYGTTQGGGAYGEGAVF